jgi:hypothetical protein
MARMTCLYCGARLPSELLEGMPRPTPVAEAPPREASSAGPNLDRVLVVFGPGRASAGAVADAFGITEFEAEQRLKRTGFHLHRILDPTRADAEASRLRSAGLEVFAIPEAELAPALDPLLVRSGHNDTKALTLRTDSGEHRVEPAAALLLVTGAIRREYATDIEKMKRARLLLDEGSRFHVHLHGGERPLEIDPEAFFFDGPQGLPASSLLEIRSWMTALAAVIPRDDDFRFLPPALAPTDERPGSTVFDAVAALRSGREAPTVLDNLKQFRFYSAWRGAVARRVGR